MKRLLILLLSAMMVLPPASGQTNAPADSLTGNWTGTSICQLKNSLCRDENVMFLISPGSHADSHSIRADKVLFRKLTLSKARKD